MYDRVEGIKRNIKLSEWTTEELISLNQFIVKQVKFKRSLEAQKMKRQLFVGSTVNFEDNSGVQVTGTIKKVMRKYAQVRGPDRTVWRVPLSALSKGAA
jgi:hypothetical protein